MRLLLYPFETYRGCQELFAYADRVCRIWCVVVQREELARSRVTMAMAGDRGCSRAPVSLSARGLPLRRSAETLARTGELRELVQLSNPRNSVLGYVVAYMSPYHQARVA